MKIAKNFSYKNLESLIDADHSNSAYKGLAELLLAAMNDWPTADQQNIYEFIDELKHYFGNPLTIKSISKKQLDMQEEHCAWRIESGASIISII